MEAVSRYADQVIVPTASSTVWKDECAFSFETPESEDGLFIDMNSWIAYSKHFAQLNFERTGHGLYLNIKRRVTEKKPEGQEEGQEPPKKKATLLGIGVQGGFEGGPKVEQEDTYSLVVLPEWHHLPVPTQGLPEKVERAINAIIHADSASAVQNVTEWVADKDLKVSKCADNLWQLSNGKKIPVSNWKCEHPGCDKTENLWLNLSDGTILCGRRNWDGSGGNGHALEYYEKTGFPLSVKLGTITPQGADVFDYIEGDMVIDPKLSEHLAHWGIDMHKMEKTEKTIAELELDLQYSYDWNRIQEQGKTHSPLYGPGFTGIQNLGNSCYMSSVMQVIFALPEFQQRYYAQRDDIIRNAPSNPTQDFHTQMAKFADGLLSGNYSHPRKEESENATRDIHTLGIRPRMFKTLVGKGHPEFSTMRQQDALEFFQYLINMVQQKERGYSGAAKGDPSQSFRFKIQDKYVCNSSKKAKFTTRDENLLSVGIPLDKMTNMEEYAAFELRQKELKDKGLQPGKDEQVVRPHLSLLSCLEEVAAPETIHDFYSTAINAKTTATKTTRMVTFPKYLVVHLRKYTFTDMGLPKKLDVFVDVPDEIDLRMLKRLETPNEEELLPEGNEPKQLPEPNPDIVSQLQVMGFPELHCKKAALNSGNADPEAAMNWLLSHMDDPTLNEPLEPAGGGSGGPSVSEEAVVMLSSMGFTRDQAIRALKATNGDVERATDWIFSHAEEMDAEQPTDAAAAETNAMDVEDASRYRLVAFISHIGGSTATGHYVCHIKKDNRWVIFNDEKVAISEDTPKDMGYLYFFERL